MLSLWSYSGLGKNTTNFCWQFDLKCPSQTEKKTNISNIWFINVYGISFPYISIVFPNFLSFMADIIWYRKFIIEISSVFQFFPPFFVIQHTCFLLFFYFMAMKIGQKSHQTWTEIHHPFLDVATLGGRTPFRAAAAQATSWRRAPRAARRRAGGGGSASLETPWGWRGEDGYEWDINKGISIGKSIINHSFGGLKWSFLWFHKDNDGVSIREINGMWIEAIIKHTYGSLNKSFCHMSVRKKIADDQKVGRGLGILKLVWKPKNHRPPTYRYPIQYQSIWSYWIHLGRGTSIEHSSHKWMERDTNLIDQQTNYQLRILWICCASTS